LILLLRLCDLVAPQVLILLVQFCDLVAPSFDFTGSIL